MRSSDSDTPASTFASPSGSPTSSPRLPSAGLKRANTMAVGRTPGESMAGPVRGLSIRKVQTPVVSEDRAQPPPVKSEPLIVYT